MHVGLYDPRWKGHHTVYARLVCRYLLDAGHRVTFCTSTAHERLSVFPADPRLTIKQLPGVAPGQDGLLRSQFAEAQRVRRALNVLDEVDIVHHLCIDYLEVPFRVATASRSAPPLVATLHRDHFDAGATGLVDRLMNRGVRRALGGAVSSGTIDRLVVHADTIRDRVVRTLRVPGPSVVTAPCPTPELSRDQTSTEARMAIDLPIEVPLLLFFGGLRSEKGPDVLGQALATIDSDVVVVFAGPADDFDGGDVDRWAARSADPVTVVNRVGFVPDEDVETYFRAADALVLPYRRSKGISGPLRRACQTDTHIISCDDSDIGALVETHDLGQTFTRGSHRSLTATIEEFLVHRDRYPTDAVAAYGRSQLWTAAGSVFETQYEQIRGNSETRHEWDTTVREGQGVNGQ